MSNIFIRAEDGIRDRTVTGVQTCALPIWLGEQLAEIHGQHEHQRLLQPLAQLELLDRFADAEDAVARMAALHAEYRAARSEERRVGKELLAGQMGRRCTISTNAVIAGHSF